MNVLVTDGAGTLGGVILERLLAQGRGKIVSYDEAGVAPARPPSEVVSAKGSLADRELLVKTLEMHQIEAVIHTAEAGPASESIEQPHRHFERSVTDGHSLLGAMLTTGVKKIVFASSAAVYGAPESVPVREEAELRPLTPYGESKLAFERMLPWYEQAYGIRSAILRNFNTAGAGEQIGGDHRTKSSLISRILDAAAGEIRQVDVYGEDYPTPDGTCIRDYVHIVDLADAHLLALEAIKERSGVYNLGYGNGYSVAEVIEMARQVTGRAIRSEAAPRRPGDAPILIADANKMMGDLGWAPRQSELDRILESAWKWRMDHPNGYN